MNYYDPLGLLAQMPKDGGVNYGGFGLCDGVAVYLEGLPYLCFTAGGPGGGPPPPTKVPDEYCFLEVKYRAVGSQAPGYNHAYIWLQDRYGNVVTIEGFPERSTFEDWGYLTVQNSRNGKGTTDAWNDSQSGLTLVSPGLAGATNAKIIPDLCARIDKLFRAELYYTDHQVAYDAIGGPNSNTLAHWLLIQAGVDTYFTAPPGTTNGGGWNFPLYN